jgi:hypothetical protein
MLKSLFVYLVWLAELCLSLCFVLNAGFSPLPISFVFTELSLQMMLFGACDKQAVQKFC